jgi:methionyl aminopeptidase
MKNILALEKTGGKLPKTTSSLELKTPTEIAKMRLAGKIVAEVFEILKQCVKPGVTTKLLDHVGFTEIKSRGGAPAFLNYNGFPSAVCTSVNEEVVHGIPSAGRILSEGDIISIDMGVVYNGYYADAAVTLAVGNVNSRVLKLIEVTKTALENAILHTKPGAYLGDVSNAIETAALENKMNVVKDFVGHGIGRNLHEEPAVLNYGQKGTGIKLKPGLVLAIEPMINLGASEVEITPDGWTVVTKDKTFSAHFEHTVAVTENGNEILTVL